MSRLPDDAPSQFDLPARTEPPSSAEFIEVIRREFPGFKLVPKRSDGLSRCIDVFLKVLTFGGQRHYMTRYHTVIGQTLFVPDAWNSTAEVDKVVLLRHERVHLRQRRRLTFVGMAFLYLIPWFPVGLAYFRARLEWEAYTETLRATAELKGLAAAQAPELRKQIVMRFLGPDYGWMWPFRSQVESWYDAALAELRPDVRPAKDSPRRAGTP